MKSLFLTKKEEMTHLVFRVLTVHLFSFPVPYRLDSESLRFHCNFPFYHSIMNSYRYLHSPKKLRIYPLSIFVGSLLAIVVTGIGLSFLVTTETNADEIWKRLTFCVWRCYFNNIQGVPSEFTSMYICKTVQREKWALFWRKLAWNIFKMVVLPFITEIIIYLLISNEILYILLHFWI